MSRNNKIPCNEHLDTSSEWGECDCGKNLASFSVSSLMSGLCSTNFQFLLSYEISLTILVLSDFISRRKIPVLWHLFEIVENRRMVSWTTIWMWNSPCPRFCFQLKIKRHVRFGNYNVLFGCVGILRIEVIYGSLTEMNICSAEQNKTIYINSFDILEFFVVGLF